MTPSLLILYSCPYAHRSDVDGSTSTAAVSVDGDCLVAQESPTKRSAALFLLKTRNEGRLTQSALNNVVNSTSDLCQQVAHKLKRKFSEIVVDSPMSESDKRAMIHTLNNVECAPFEGIGTEYLQEKYYKESFGYLVSALTAPIQQCRKYPYTIIYRRHIYLVRLAMCIQ